MQKIYCGNCGEVLYQSLNLESPQEIMRRNEKYDDVPKTYKSTCPKCKKELSANGSLEKMKIYGLNPDGSRFQSKKEQKLLI